MFIDHINIYVEKFDLTRVLPRLYLCGVKTTDKSCLTSNSKNYGS